MRKRRQPNKESSKHIETNGAGEPTRPIGPRLNTSVYKGFSLEDAVRRQGSIDIFKSPSKFGNFLHYPNGDIKESTNG